MMTVVMNSIQLIVGLGNIGAQYERTRHNAGFWFVDLLAAQYKAQFKPETKFLGDVAKIKCNGQDIVLLKPNTFMNASGREVKAISHFYKTPPTNILVVHDELDLPVGSAKLKLGGGHGGHNGLRDIDAQLATRDYWRLRLGIGHPGDRNEVINFVLKAPTKDEQAAIDEKVYESTKLIDLLLTGEFENAMLKLHTKK
jgi:PTH1 family peptidyl-tRNA hydrolase